MKVLVTGSSGMIGTALCEALLDRGYEVVGVDVRENPWSQRVDAFTVIADLCKESVGDDLPRESDLVVHLAANARVYELVMEPSKARDNVLMTFNLLEHCRQKGIRRIIFASSREVYGNSREVIRNEDDVDAARCESPYSASKLAGEALVRSYSKCYGVGEVILRFSNVYGRYDASDRVIPLFIRQTLSQQDLVIFGKEKLLDFTYLDDAVSGVTRAIERFDQVKGQTFNIATGVGTPLTRIAAEIRDRLGATNRMVVRKNRPGEVVRFVADISRATEQLGYIPEITLEDGLSRTIDWYRRFYGDRPHVPAGAG